MGNVIQSKAAHPTTPAAKLGHLLAKQFNYAMPQRGLFVIVVVISLDSITLKSVSKRLNRD